jgi:RHS repeat-associated protein
VKVARTVLRGERASNRPDLPDAMEGHGTPILSENQYQYNGKELNSDFGLDLYDYGARWYDASVGRWHGVDPLAEAFIVHSPYNYGVNNPIMMVDINGRFPRWMNFGKGKKGRQLKRQFRRLRRTNPEFKTYLNGLKNVYGRGGTKSGTTLNIRQKSGKGDLINENGTVKPTSSTATGNGKNSQATTASGKTKTEGQEDWLVFGNIGGAESSDYDVVEVQNIEHHKLSFVISKEMSGQQTRQFSIESHIESEVFSHWEYDGENSSKHPPTSQNIRFSSPNSNTTSAILSGSFPSSLEFENHVLVPVIVNVVAKSDIMIAKVYKKRLFGIIPTRRYDWDNADFRYTPKTGESIQSDRPIVRDLQTVGWSIQD